MFDVFKRFLCVSTCFPNKKKGRHVVYAWVDGEEIYYTHSKYLAILDPDFSIVFENGKIVRICLLKENQGNSK